jgi:hypothetical protein
MAKVNGVNSIPFWGSFVSTTGLPNVAGSPKQTSALEVGDQAFVSVDGSLWYCTTATLGAAVWQRIGVGQGPIIAKWNELDVTQFTVVRGAAVTLSRVAGARAAYMRIHIVASGDDVIVVGFSGATIPTIDASRNTRAIFSFDVMATPSGDIFNSGTGGNAQVGSGIYGMSGGNAFATFPMFYANLANVQGHRLTAGTLLDAGGTPSDFGCGNYGPIFSGAVLPGRIYNHKASWLIQQPAGTHVSFEAVYTTGPRSTSPFSGQFPYDDTGDSTAGGTNTGAWAASWNDVVMTNPCIGIRTGRAGTFDIDFANLVLSRPLSAQ